MRDLIDIITALLLFIILLPVMIIISWIIKLTSDGPVFYYSERVGKNNKLFRMPKFRTMINNTPAIATHLLRDPKEHYTPVGKFLRQTSLDEIPQLISIIKGDMRFIGPRPALFNQEDLIQLRTERGIHKFKPGLTGWAQINGRDDISIPEKVVLDEEYINNISLRKDFYIFLRTILKVLKKDSITH